jgi:hypothetical protein
VGSNPPSNVVINELTTVASAFTAAQFIHGEAISGNPLGLRIAAGNVPNLIDLTTGHWGKVLVDPLNSTQTATLATFDTLGSLVTAFFTVADDAWRGRFLKAASPNVGPTPTTTLEALADIAREPWSAPKELFSLFDQVYPQPADGSRRAAPFLPYLALVPPDFTLSLCFAGGGMYANGRFMLDTEGNLWSGQNWMPGSQSGGGSKHRRRRSEDDAKWDAALAANHRLHRHGSGWRRLGHPGDKRSRLGIWLQRKDSGHGPEWPTGRERERSSIQGEALRADGRQRCR